MEFRANGLEQAAARMAARAGALNDMTVPFTEFGAWLDKQTDDCFQYSRDFGGEPFKPLAQSTIESRIRRLKGARRTVGKTGILTAKSAAFQRDLRAPGGIKPLVDTGRARNSARSVASKVRLRWSAVGYLGYSMDGHGHPPKRDPSAFDRVGGKWRLHPRAWTQLRKLVLAHAQGGAAH
jgi:hypothetical protein